MVCGFICHLTSSCSSLGKQLQTLAMVVQTACGMACEEIVPAVIPISYLGGVLLCWPTITISNCSDFSVMGLNIPGNTTCSLSRCLVLSSSWPWYRSNLSACSVPCMVMDLDCAVCSTADKHSNLAKFHIKGMQGSCRSQRRVLAGLMRGWGVCSVTITMAHTYTRDCTCAAFCMVILCMLPFGK